MGNRQVIHKAKPCSFSDTDLHAHLEKLGKKKVVLGGVDPAPDQPAKDLLIPAQATWYPCPSSLISLSISIP